MGRKRKLAKFSELKTFGNVYQVNNARDPVIFNHSGRPANLAGSWAKTHFGNTNPVVLELACGKGEYTLGLAAMNEKLNCIGVDIKGARIWKGAKHAWLQSISNVAFIRSPIEWIDHYFSPAEISQIWITFPDPFLRKSKAVKRLTSPRFIAVYRNILMPEGLVHLKTDSDELFQYTLEVIDELKLSVVEKIDDVYNASSNPKLTTIQTFYEKMHLANSKTIKYVSFKLS